MERSKQVLFPECPLLAKLCAEALTSLYHTKSPEEHATAPSPGRETEARGSAAVGPKPQTGFRPLTVYEAGLRSPREGLRLIPIPYQEVQALRI